MSILLWFFEDFENNLGLKALIMRVITMTPEQINQLPPAERQTYIQLVRHAFWFLWLPAHENFQRATLGVPT